MTQGAILGLPFEWVYRRAALRDARAALAAADERRDATAVRQARLLLEVARRLPEPTATTPPAAQRAIALSLYRRAAGWARAARSHEDSQPEDRTPPALEAGENDVAHARAAAEALVLELEAPRRRIERVLVQRWSRLALLGAGALLLAVGARVLAVGPDLAAGRPFRISSTWPGWPTCLVDNKCNRLMFHTDTQDNPWVEIDLGAPREVRRIDVFNRDNCCFDQATPLVAELSTDGAVWSQVARSDRDFGSWTARFPAHVARFVRLRVPRRSTLHLRAVAVR